MEKNNEEAVVLKRLGRKVYNYIGKAIYNYGLIKEGDRIILGISGGKDSFVLLHDFARRMKKSPVKFYFEAVHVVSDLAKEHHQNELEALFHELNAPYHFINVATKARLKEGENFNCYWCAMQRRLEIFKYATENNFNKIAYAHHLDDVVETTLLNMFYKGEISSIVPYMKYDKYPIDIIRPMYTIEERDVERLAEALGFVDLSQWCELKDVSRRKTMKDVVATLAKDTKQIRRNVLNAMMNIKTDYLPKRIENEKNNNTL